MCEKKKSGGTDFFHLPSRHEPCYLPTTGLHTPTPPFPPFAGHALFMCCAVLCCAVKCYVPDAAKTVQILQTDAGSCAGVSMEWEGGGERRVAHAGLSRLLSQHAPTDM